MRVGTCALINSENGVGDDKMDQVSTDGGIIVWLELLCRTGILRELPPTAPREDAGVYLSQDEARKLAECVLSDDGYFQILKRKKKI